jgi:glutaredoxin
VRFRAERPAQPRVLVLTRPGCHLCQSALEVVAAVCGETGDQWTERNVDDDEDLIRRYTDQVPVTFVDGQQHDFWRVDPDRLRKALSASARRRG